MPDAVRVGDWVLWWVQIVKTQAEPDGAIIVDVKVRIGETVEVYENGITVAPLIGELLAIPHGRYTVIERLRNLKH